MSSLLVSIAIAANEVLGHWALEVAAGEPYVQGSLHYLDAAIKRAAKYNLKVMVRGSPLPSDERSLDQAQIDLHGVPGGQNGFDNSGRRDVLKWPTATNQKRTRNVLRTLSAEYAKLSYRNVVTAIRESVLETSISES